MNYQKLLLKKQGANKNSIPDLYLDQKKQPLSLMQDRYQNWSCVLDPAIALSHYGVTIAENMGKEIELWVVRELWNIINNAEFYTRRTELITPEAISTKQIAAETIWSLKEWAKTKQEKDLARLGVYWLGDNLQESFLPHNKPVEFFKQWEALATALDKRNESISNDDSEILTSAVRDTIALAGSLKSAFILTYQLPTEFERGSSLPICEMLKTWGISCQAIEPHHPIVAMEREYILQLIVRAGLGKLLLAGVHLAAFHLVIPATTAPDTPHTDSQLPIPNSTENYPQESYFWNKVKGLWYYL